MTLNSNLPFKRHLNLKFKHGDYLNSEIIRDSVSKCERNNQHYIYIFHKCKCKFKVI